VVRYSRFWTLGPSLHHLLHVICTLEHWGPFSHRGLDVDHRKKGSGSTSSQSEETIRQYALTTRVCPAASSFQWPTVVHKTGGEKAAMVCPLRLWETAKPTGLDRRRERFETKQGSRLRGAPSEPLMRRRLARLLPAAAGCRAPLLVLFRAGPHLPFPERGSTLALSRGKWRFDRWPLSFGARLLLFRQCRFSWKRAFGTMWGPSNHKSST
jgi:hypothetical protein